MDDPYLVVGSPSCNSLPAVQGGKRAGRGTLKVACELYKKQIDKKRRFLDERLKNATSWKEECVKGG